MLEKITSSMSSFPQQQHPSKFASQGIFCRSSSDISLNSSSSSPVSTQHAVQTRTHPDSTTTRLTKYMPKPVRCLCAPAYVPKTARNAHEIPMAMNTHAIQSSPATKKLQRKLPSNIDIPQTYRNRNINICDIQ